MPYDRRMDAYIAKSPEFAKPILTYIRETVHAACPDVVETMKWSSPFFDHHGPLCQMAAFKQHCGFGFWQGALVVEESGESGGPWRHLTSVKDLPSKKALTAYVRKAVAINEAGTKIERPKREKPALETPDDLTAALKKNAKARKTFEAFSPSAQREYVEWIVGAKTAATRDKRLATALEWMAEGKRRHWKYQ